MKLRNLGFVLGSFTAVLFAVACSSSSGDDSSATGGDAATGSDTSTGSDTGTTDTGTSSCTPLADGTYTVHSTGADGGPSCPPPDFNLTIPAAVVDAGGVDSGPNPCTSSTDSTTCTTTVTCNSTSAGYTTASTTTYTPSTDGTSATGTSTSTTTEPDGGIYSSCTGITTTYTKQ